MFGCRMIAVEIDRDNQVQSGIKWTFLGMQPNTQVDFGRINTSVRAGS